MIGPRHCPYCRTPALRGCEHLALAIEGRDFVRACIEKCHAQRIWETLCQWRRRRLKDAGEWSPESEDYTWLETAFCDEFLRGLRWFGGLDHEWRSGPKPEQGGFWVLLWSKDPQCFWWELRDSFERHCLPTGKMEVPSLPSTTPTLFPADLNRPRNRPRPS
jgi:hypothetical protein